MERITEIIEKFPAKKAPNGRLVDGSALHDLLLEGKEILNGARLSLRNREQIPELDLFEKVMQILKAIDDVTKNLIGLLNKPVVVAIFFLFLVMSFAF